MEKSKLKPNLLYYSSNELRSGVPQCFPKAESATIPLDYAWFDNDSQLVLVERKSMGDLSGSLRSKHLKKQLETAKKATNHVWLLREGLETPEDFGWERDQFLNALYSILVGLQVLQVTSENQMDSGRVLWRLYLTTRQMQLGSGCPPLSKWKYLESQPVAESYARVFKGLGFDRAKVLEKCFPCWQKLVSAKPEELVKVEGIGPVWAKKIWEFVRLEMK